MSSWTSGYTSDVTYTAGYYRELAPALLELAALSKGALLTPAAHPYAMCELGCGRGLTVNVLAAANPHAQFYANDFNPAHVAEARGLAAAGGARNVHFSEAGFADYINEPGLPTFDIIVLHGILSWVSRENREHIVAFVKRHLKPGGLVYVSYNCLPGWAAMSPLRHLMAQYGGSLATGSIGKLNKALDFVNKVKDANARYFTANPSVVERLDRLKGQNRNYLVHEYLNEEWSLFYHSEVVELFEEAKTTFLGSSNLLDHVDALNLTEAQKGVMDGIDSAPVRETVRDFFGNSQFRRDLFVKGATPGSVLESRERWLETRYVLSTMRSAVPMKVTAVLGEASLHEDVYKPLLDALAAGPKTLREMVKAPGIAALGWARMTQAMVVLVGGGHVQPCLDEKGDAKRRESTRRFNRALMERARDSVEYQALASPLTGGGIFLERFEQLYLLARQSKAPDVPAFVWQILNSIGQRLLRDGQPIESPEDNLKELAERHAAFVEKRLPVLEQLGVA